MLEIISATTLFTTMRVMILIKTITTITAITIILSGKKNELQRATPRRTATMMVEKHEAVSNVPTTTTSTSSYWSNPKKFDSANN
jgi:hypothetical protein